MNYFTTNSALTGTAGRTCVFHSQSESEIISLEVNKGL